MAIRVIDDIFGGRKSDTMAKPCLHVLVKKTPQKSVLEAFWEEFKCDSVLISNALLS